MKKSFLVLQHLMLSGQKLSMLERLKSQLLVYFLTSYYLFPKSKHIQSKFSSQSLNFLSNPPGVNVPVVGGHAGVTILPLFSQVLLGHYSFHI